MHNTLRGINWLPLAPIRLLLAFQGDQVHWATKELDRRYRVGVLDRAQPFQRNDTTFRAVLPEASKSASRSSDAQKEHPLDIELPPLEPGPHELKVTQVVGLFDGATLVHTASNSDSATFEIAPCTDAQHNAVATSLPTYDEFPSSIFSPTLAKNLEQRLRARLMWTLVDWRATDKTGWFLQVIGESPCFVCGELWLRFGDGAWQRLGNIQQCFGSDCTQCASRAYEPARLPRSLVRWHHRVRPDTGRARIASPRKHLDA